MTDFATIAPKLGRFVRLLGSDRDGEVVAAARAIARVLKAAGLDLHDLANAIAAPQLIEDQAEVRPNIKWHELRAFCLAHACFLSFRERQFLNDLGRWRGDITVRQRDWLEAIYVRLRREAA